jgi:hypothetical protein
MSNHPELYSLARSDRRRIIELTRATIRVMGSIQSDLWQSSPANYRHRERVVDDVFSGAMVLGLEPREVNRLFFNVA